MKRFKKFLAGVVALALAVAFVLPAGVVRAEDPTTTITVNDNDPSGKPYPGRTYGAWRLLNVTTTTTGTAGSEKTNYIYSVPEKYRDALTTVINSIKANTITGADDTEKDRQILAWLGKLKDDNTTLGTGDVSAATFAKAMVKYLTTAGTAIATDFPSSVSTAQAAAVFSGVPYGYYLIYDKTEDGESPAKDFSRTAALLDTKAEATASIDAKNEPSSIDKKEKDYDASKEAPYTETYSDTTGSYDVGTQIPYQSKILLPTEKELMRFEKYKLVAQDIMSTGLAYQDDLKIRPLYANDTTASDIDLLSASAATVEAPFVKTTVSKTGSIIVDEPFSSNQGFIVTADDILPYYKAQKAAGKPIKGFLLEYSGKLTTAAVFGTPENNRITLKFSNDPNSDGMGETTEKKVYAFTFRIKVNKKDETNTKTLPDAKFKISKLVYNSTWKEVIGSGTATANQILVEGLTANSDASAGKFYFGGLDLGMYKVEEVEAPVGYTPIAPFYVTLSATYAADGTSVTALNVTLSKNADGSGEFTNNEVTRVTDSRNDPDVSVGTAVLNVINTPAGKLPATGGIGRTIFYVLGAVLAIGAGIALVVRRKLRYSA